MLLPGIVLTGVGTGMVMRSLSAAAVARLPHARFGVGSAVNQAVRQIGSVFRVALVVVLLSHQPGLEEFTVKAFTLDDQRLENPQTLC